MSTQLEDRLTAALSARADQVRPEDLAPIEVPRARRVVRLHPPTAYALVAAACLAAVAAPFVLNNAHSARHESAPATFPTVTGGADWPVVDQSDIDVDGDGHDDTVRLRSDGSGIRVEVEPSTGGGLTAVVLRETGKGAKLAAETPDLNGDGAREVLVQFPAEHPDWPMVQVAPVVLTDGGFVEPAFDPQQFDVRRDADTEFHTKDFWVDADGALIESSIVDGWDPSAPADTEVQTVLTSWTLDADRMVHTGLGTKCLRVSAPRATYDCSNAPADGTTALTPAAGPWAGAGEKATMQLDDGDPDTIGLTGQSVTDCADQPQGTFQLVVASSVYGDQTTQLAAGPTPRLLTRPIVVDGGYGPMTGALVERVGCSETTVEAYFWHSDSLYPTFPKADAGVFFGTRGDQVTWAAPDGSLYTRQPDAADGRFRTWQWSITKNDEFVPTDLGVLCLTGDDTPTAC
jgi:hypothetical protein